MSIKSIIENMQSKAPDFISKQSGKIQNIGAHGEITLIRVNEIPTNLEEVNPSNGEYILAHSETGHNHVMDADEDVKMYREDAMTAFIRITGGAPKKLHQHRSNNPHSAQAYEPGIYKVINAREYDLSGQIRRSMD